MASRLQTRTVDMINCTRHYDNAEPNYKKAYRPEQSSQ